MRESLDAMGFVLRAKTVPEPALVRLLAACTPTAGTELSRHPSGDIYGIRGLLWASVSLRAELDASGVSALAAFALGRAAFPVDAIFFDKQPNANWSVPGHQDRLMPGQSASVVRKVRRGSLPYFEPPATTLAALVALRVCFDDEEVDGGGLEAVPGSHRLGVLQTDAIRSIPLTEYRPCVAARGDVLLMRPLLLHRSARRTAGGHRRVLHVVYASEQPSDGAHWMGPGLTPFRGILAGRAIDHQGDR
jgi:hypothetical protein